MKHYDYQQFENYLEILLAQDVINNWQAFGPGHYRLNGEVDVWPKNKTYQFYKEKAEHYKNLRDLF